MSSSPTLGLDPQAGRVIAPDGKTVRGARTATNLAPHLVSAFDHAAQAITDAGGDYVLTVTLNQPSLYRACKAVPWAAVPAHTSSDTRGGRRATGIKVITAPAWVTFNGAAQVAQLRRTTTRAGRKNIEVV